jgi:hypothetical protein
MAGDNGRTLAAPKYRAAKMQTSAASFIHGSALRRDVLALFNPEVFP